MRVSIVAPFLGPVRGGVERHATDLAGVLQGRGHSVALGRTVPKDRGAASDWVLFEGVDRRALGRWRSSRRGTRTGIFLHGSFFSGTHAAELRARGWPGTPGDAARRVFDRFWMRRCLEGADAIFTLSQAETEDVARLFPSIADRLLAVPNVIRATERAPDPAPARGAPYVVAVSRIDRRKNFPMIPRALAGSDIGFRLAGQDFGDLAAVYRSARQAGYGGFEYLGPVEAPEARRLIQGAVATVLPSYFEGVPYLVLQSMALGVPALCTDLCYLDPVPGVLLSPPEAASWGRLLGAWERGPRPSPGPPPGPEAWGPMLRRLEEPPR
jgi:glycosyltransferase involved in cell wall biosynthesis